jgi:catechol 2,3-dioxygenase-like lactoylglutathione lyase family enzyme
MSRLQLALNVEDLESAVAFYQHLFGTEPAKRKPGYANFVVADPPLKLVLFEGAGAGGTVNHLGIEVEDVAEVEAAATRLAQHDLAAAPPAQDTCCYARQEKFWLSNTPDDVRWEVYAVLDHTEQFSGESENGREPGCCADTTAVALTQA